MDKRFLFWGLCFVLGLFAAFGFDQATAKTTPTAASTAFSFTITAAPALKQIGNLKGAVLGELQTAKFDSLNQIESSNIVINNLQIENQPSPTPSLSINPTPTSTPSPTPRSLSKVEPSLTPTPTTTPKPTTTPLPTAVLSPTPTPTPLAYQKAINNLSMALVTNDYQTFNALLSGELTSTFGENAVKESFEQAQATYGGITAINPLSVIQQTGDWATQEVETKTQNGLTSKFRIILHLENGQWKLFGTQEIP